MSAGGTLRLFEGYGVELEYMVVDRDTLSVLPAADEILRALSGEYADEVEQGELSWSNELVLHVIEFKTNGPVPSLSGLASVFDRHLARAREILRPHGGRFMPTAMHPWMDPARETVLWPHAYNEVYESFNRIFDCRGHGWSNLQSVHLNLPFSGDGEFARLHAAIRLVLPLIPALAASSPIVDGRPSGFRDTRLVAYRDNAKRIPSVTGKVIPEAVFTKAEYEEKILGRIYRDLAPYDPGGVLRHEFVNARGAIARFERDTIEIRTVDAQECPRADIAVAYVVAGAVQALVEERWLGLADQKRFDTDALNRILVNTTRDAERAVIADAGYLRAFGLGDSGCRAGDVWRRVVETVVTPGGDAGVGWEEPIGVILRDGTLASRILEALDGDASAARVKDVYGRLCDCLDEGTMFGAG